MTNRPQRILWGLMLLSASRCSEAIAPPVDASTASTTATTSVTTTSMGSASEGSTHHGHDTAGMVDGTSMGQETTAGDGSGGPSPVGPVCPLSEPEVTVLSFDAPLFGMGDDPVAANACGIPNPQRGLHRFVDLRSVVPGSLRPIAADGTRVIYGQCTIPEFIEAPISDAVLDQLRASLAEVRAAGLSVAPRIYYASDIGQPDAPLAVVLAHIEQLAPIFAEHSDVIVAVQAGFVGAWGEWHSSTNALTEPAARKAIIDALLDAVPTSRQIQVRRPSFKQVAYGGPLTDATAHDPSALARLGHLNDCVLASDNDFGTYVDAAEKDYAIADSPFVVVGGETCAVNPPRSACPSALEEFAQLHWTYLNRDYHPDVIASWDADGCLPEIECRLGYRLALTEARWSETASPGEPWSVALTFYNDGWAAPINERPVQLVMEGAEQTYWLDLPIDVRTLAAGTSTPRCVDLELPADLVPGHYQLGIRLPSDNPALATDPRYSIHLLGPEWDETTGIHGLGASLMIQSR